MHIPGRWIHFNPRRMPQAEPALVRATARRHVKAVTVPGTDNFAALNLTRLKRPKPVGTFGGMGKQLTLYVDEPKSMPREIHNEGKFLT